MFVDYAAQQTLTVGAPWPLSCIRTEPFIATKELVEFCHEGKLIASLRLMNRIKIYNIGM